MPPPCPSEYRFRPNRHQGGPSLAWWLGSAYDAFTMTNRRKRLLWASGLMILLWIVPASATDEPTAEAPAYTPPAGLEKGWYTRIQTPMGDILARLLPELASEGMTAARLGSATHNLGRARAALEGDVAAALARAVREWSGM